MDDGNDSPKRSASDLHDFARRVMDLSAEWRDRFADYASDMNDRTTTPFGAHYLMTEESGEAIHDLLTEIGLFLLGADSSEGLRRAASSLRDDRKGVMERKGAAVARCDDVIRFWKELYPVSEPRRRVQATDGQGEAWIADGLARALGREHRAFENLRTDDVLSRLRALSRENASPVSFLYELMTLSHVNAWSGTSRKSLENAWTAWKKRKTPSG
ncbi:MAG: hypothetical protein AAF500_16410 [Myxococcota bacterium]